jgi:hypothetical protein
MRTVGAVLTVVAEIGIRVLDYTPCLLAACWR